MTDSMAALRLLVDHGGDEGPKALDAFYRRWSKEPLVIDKWFSVQATSSREGTLERRRAGCCSTRTSRCAIRIGCRSLVGAFCTANPARFHAATAADTDSLPTGCWSWIRSIRRSRHGS
jgi:aminopeptidase N